MNLNNGTTLFYMREMYDAGLIPHMPFRPYWSYGGQYDIMRKKKHNYVWPISLNRCYYIANTTVYTICPYGPLGLTRATVAYIHSNGPLWAIIMT